MENKNIQWSRSACDLTWPSPQYPAVTVYKRHLGGVSMASYKVTLGMWTWSWRARVGMVPCVHKEGVSGPSNLRTNLKKLLNTLKV
jgi:hypothetical protein